MEECGSNILLLCYLVHIPLIFLSPSYLPAMTKLIFLNCFLQTISLEITYLTDVNRIL